MNDNYSVIGANFNGVEADARLIAAAPNLLQALKHLVMQADEDTPSEYRTNSFRAALDAAWNVISKAEGWEA
jgi:hypothetical protein